MRITGGSACGRRLVTPASGRDSIRPTCDRVREALFNLLGARPMGSRVLDLFAGTGVLGIEALSRGAVFALFVDRSLTAGRLIETNLRACLPQPAAAFVRMNLATATSLEALRAGLEPGVAFDLIFLDPPYRQNLAKRVLPLLDPGRLLNPGALVVVEEHARAELPTHTGALTLADQRRYGETCLWIYRQQLAGT
ncbi:MAG: 16S rRNA (guanine(966)-N(2))-methyltransferase RsmD [Desulfobulbus sp.]|nr:16S rRNA (guanine(966)-N(2))-methyltransferase RsmD [Desulfobulbus sp.]